MSEGSNAAKNTGDKLLLAAIDLMASKGYKGVTTQEIAAAAGLSEKTLFRHFGSKQNLLEAAFDRFHYAEEMTRLFNEKLVWDLETDLLLISRTYHEIMNRNRKMIMISVKEADHLPGFRERTIKHPKQFIEILTRYFTEMTGQGKLIESNAELQAYSFISMNYGVFLNNLNAGEHFPGLTLEDFITESVGTFTRGLAR
ncbi:MULTISPECIES: TetR/AcrR family transcriptional regulator [unclassified Paenibacillus]|uniref:TetR/AcrR family transcriptional regulator n=1 Tax=unclassified Paenibacillus TaxID=185978 RepID=UPI00240664F2|nr:MULTISPECIES: TetR/AcrR family transcriptional regulator [unclassified Paenibacillus]MDF9841692.1 TetR/AcrR family transcriptional repressor of mexJK operon [Paenibacillus sp. PastF-2]MDF9848196.1 TetR/AcrR family transcriptional repressor of mexJK operon [Paenibacillus sp. PastM-2]MDF9854851.1 TetR/AcrR family transcriptional repressor of mexJK operon [Paenibacillus sp. PastF-1]MDH6480121.1 TetR/AcrR family transcriptional repressor of mexJK operon [Paenibacillus sp. PastH-2]MDH6507552.1 T